MDMPVTMMTKDEVLKIRLQAWIYTGVETEMELMEAYASKEDESEEGAYWNKRIKQHQAKLELINKRIRDLEAKVA
jgi:hypothetical protein